LSVPGLHSGYHPAWLEEGPSLFDGGLRIEIPGELDCSRFRADAGPQFALADRIERFGRAMTATQLASVLAVSRIIIYKLAKKNRIPSFRVGSCVRFDPKAAAAWLRKE
jgi:excisionase family DNA binding protein